MPDHMHAHHKTGMLMSFEEIGRELGISHKAANMLYRRAMQKLKLRPELVEKLRKIGDKRGMRHG